MATNSTVLADTTLSPTTTVPVPIAPYLMGVGSFLQFYSLNITYFPAYIQSQNNDPVMWTAAWPTDVIIRLLFTVPRMISFACNAKSEDKTELTKVEFCFDFVSSSNFKTSETCFTLSENYTQRNVTLFNSEAYLQFYAGEGATANLFLMDIVEDWDVVYVHCKATNRKGTIVSNRAILDDFRAIFSQKSVYHQFPRINIFGSTYLRCGAQKMNLMLNKLKASPLPRYDLPFRWHSCSGGPLSSCSKLDLGKDWRFQVMSIFGDLILHQPPSKEAVVSQMIPTRSFVCSLFGNVLSIYNVTLSFDERYTVRKLNLIYPQFGVVVLLNQPGFVYKMPAYYMGNLVEVSDVFWRKSKANLESGREYFKGALTVSKECLTFRAPFMPEIADVYSYFAIFSYLNSRAPSERAFGSFRVTVLNIPVVSEAVPSTILAFLDKEFKMTCKLRSAETVVKIRFCGQDMDTNNPRSFIKSVKDKCGSLISPNITPFISDYPPRAGKPLIFGHRVPKNVPPSSYQVTCIGSDNNFQTQKDIIVKVRKPPEFETSYTLYAHDTCYTKCTFTCGLKKLEYYLDNGFFIKYFWSDTPGVITDLSKETKFDEESFKQTGGNEHSVGLFAVSVPRILACRIQLVSAYSGDVVYESPALAVEVSPGCSLNCAVLVISFFIILCIVGAVYLLYLRRGHHILFRH